MSLDERAEVHTQLYAMEHEDHSYREPLVKEAADLDVITEAGITQVEKNAPDTAAAIRVAREHAKFSAGNLQLVEAAACTWQANQRQQQKQQADAIDTQLAKQATRRDEAASSGEDAIKRRNEGIVACGLPYVPGYTPAEQETALSLKQPPIEAICDGLTPTDPAAPGKKSVMDVVFDTAAPCVAGALAGGCLLEMLGVQVIKQLEKGETGAPLFIAVGAGTVLVHSLGRIIADAIRSLMQTQGAAIYKFPRTWVQIGNLLQIVGVCLVVSGEVTLESMGLMRMHNELIMEAARFGDASMAPLPVVVYVLIASVFSVPYILYKYSHTKKEIENEVRWNACARALYEWEQKQRASGPYEEAYRASLEYVAATNKEEKATREIARLKEERAQVTADLILPEPYSRALRSAAASVRGTTRVVLAMIDAALGNYWRRDLYRKKGRVPLLSASGLRSGASKVRRASEDWVRSGRAFCGKAWSALSRRFQPERNTDSTN